MFMYINRDIFLSEKKSKKKKLTLHTFFSPVVSYTICPITGYLLENKLMKLRYVHTDTCSSRTYG